MTSRLRLETISPVQHVRDRRQFLRAAGLALAAPLAAQRYGWAEDSSSDATDWPRYRQPEELAEPINLKSIELVEREGSLWLRVVDKDGDVGHALDNGRFADCRSLIERLVVPYFLNKDVRALERLIDDVYAAGRNYKYAGMPFWVGVAAAEFAILDLLGRKINKPAHTFFGTKLRSEAPVYITRLTRETTPAEEVDIVQKALKKTGADAVKLKIGGRMKNDEADEKRTQQLIPLARKELGDDVTIYVDSNGSYGFEDAVRIGRMLEEHNVAFFEEPCPWQEHAMTQRVAQALDITIAGGEQDSSLPAFDWMIRNGGFGLVQPDIYYNGGIIRALKVAKFARDQGIPVTPHSPKAGTGQHPLLTFAAVAPNLGPHIEYRDSPYVQNGVVQVPTGPGMAYD